jgi:hypothetical protein
MDRFASFLKQVNQKIDLPQPMKSRILLEISADLNDLYELYLEQGFNEKEAMQQAEIKCDLNEDTLNELIDVYDTGIYKWLHNISDRTRNKWEKMSLIFIILFSIYFIGQVFLSHQFFLNASIFVLPVVTIGILTMILFVIKFYKLFILKDHNIKRLRKKLPTILFLGSASLLVGVLGFFIDLYLTVSRIISDIDKTLIYFIEWLIRGSAHLIISLVFVILILGLWYLLYTKILRIEAAATEYIFNT